MGWGSPSNFGDQVANGARQFRLYLNGISGYGWAVGQTHSVSDGSVTPANEATAGLYIYTPWIGQGGGGKQGVGGNYLFWDLFYNTFSFGNIVGGSTDPNVTVLANTTQQVKWFYISVNNNAAWYIVDATVPSNPGVMLLNSVSTSFSGGILWKPINNYPAFAGFSAAGTNYISITPAADGRSISFGSLE
jgi:hypothetical protein